MEYNICTDVRIWARALACARALGLFASRYHMPANMRAPQHVERTRTRERGRTRERSCGRSRARTHVGTHVRIARTRVRARGDLLLSWVS